VHELEQCLLLRNLLPIPLVAVGLFVWRTRLGGLWLLRAASMPGGRHFNARGRPVPELARYGKLIDAMRGIWPAGAAMDMGAMKWSGGYARGWWPVKSIEMRFMDG
jgi:hypothetical protein